MFKNILHHLLVGFIYIFVCILALIICDVLRVPETVYIYDSVVILYTLVLFLVSYALYKYLKKYLKQKYFSKQTFTIVVSVSAAAFTVILFKGVVDISSAGVYVLSYFYIGFSTLVAYPLLVAVIYRSREEKHLKDLGLFK